jgi:antitoxin (DNA-binding transcriptional repressor) of toxin-antitoxin stability system
MKTIKASEFKAKCLQLMNEVAKSGHVIVITKNGQPVAQLEIGRASCRERVSRSV